MTFASIPFLFYFLPICLAVYFVSPWKNAALLIVSFIFYAWGEPVLILVLIASTIANHVVGKALARSPSRALLAAGVAGNLAILGGFKYLGFLAENLSAAVAALGGPSDALAVESYLPLGISFFTFQAVSFLVDVYRRDAPAPRRWTDTALFIAMFAQLIAGPIVRFKTIEGQIREREHSSARITDGARLIILGLSQKVLLANVFAIPADEAFGESPALLTAGAAWAGLIAYTLQIYFDFAGYSNMAMGLGRLFGFTLPRNFDFPYASQSVTEFWRRWHITLSAWFRDYVYIPLGGNRRGPRRTYFNLVAVFLLCGLWHGAAWAFVFWGAYHGAFLVIERLSFGRALNAAPAAARHAYLIAVVMLGWVPFRTENIAAAFAYYRALFGAAPEAWVRWQDVVAQDVQYVLAIGAAAALFPLWRGAATGAWKALRPGPTAPAALNGTGAAAQLGASAIALCVLFVLSAALLAGGAYNPFIYFRF